MGAGNKTLAAIKNMVQGDYCVKAGSGRRDVGDLAEGRGTFARTLWGVVGSARTVLA